MAQSHGWMGEKILIGLVLVFQMTVVFQWDVDHKYNALALPELHSFQSGIVNIYFPCEKYFFGLMDVRIGEIIVVCIKTGIKTTFRTPMFYFACELSPVVLLIYSNIVSTSWVRKLVLCLSVCLPICLSVSQSDTYIQ